MEILKIKIRSAQNVGKVWISRKKEPPGPIWGHLGKLFAWAGKIQKMTNFCLFFLGVMMIFPTSDPYLLFLGQEAVKELCPEEEVACEHWTTKGE